MKTVCKTNVRKAIRAAMRDNNYHDVNDEWQAFIDSWDRVCLWNWRTDAEVRTGSVVWCSFDGVNDAVNYLADELLEQYEQLPEEDRSWKAMASKWERSHPWDVLEGAERNAYENACDYFRYGESYRDWVGRGHDCGIDPSRREAVWAMAFWSMADGEAPKDYVSEYRKLMREVA